MNDRALIVAIEALVRRETEITLELIKLLAELESREAYRSMGYSSLFDYCTRGLKYSESAANRRIKAARCVRDYPEIADLILSREVSLTSICHFAPLMTRENAARVLSAVRGKSKDDVIRFVASLAPKASAPTERVRPVVVKKSPVVVSHPAPLFSTMTEPVAAPEAAVAEEPVEEVFELKFTLTKDEYEAMLRLQRLRSRTGKAPKLKDLCVAGVSALLKREDPKERIARRANRSAEKMLPPPAAVTSSVTRHVLVKVADEISGSLISDARTWGWTEPGARSGMGFRSITFGRSLWEAGMRLRPCGLFAGATTGLRRRRFLGRRIWIGFGEGGTFG